MLIILFIFLLNNPAQELFERGNLYFSAGEHLIFIKCNLITHKHKLYKQLTQVILSINQSFF